MGCTLRIDGTDYTGDCASVAVATPCVVYDTTVEGDTWSHKALGPQGFMVTITRPTDRLRRLLSDGCLHAFTVTVDGLSLTERAVLQRDAGPALICCLPLDSSRPQWAAAPTQTTTQKG